MYKKSVLSRGPTTFAEARNMAQLMQNAELLTATMPETHNSQIASLNQQVTELKQLFLTENDKPSVSANQIGVNSKMCAYCNGNDHWVSDCPVKKVKFRLPQGEQKQMYCEYCEGSNHLIEQCFQKKRDLRQKLSRPKISQNVKLSRQ